MANIVKRNTVVAAMTESTENTLIEPSANTDYLPVRPDFEVQIGYENLVNEELRSSIGPAKSVQGFEVTSATIPLYLKPSGTTAEGPDAARILKAAFGNEENAAAEYDTVSSSAVDTVKVDSGEGASFRRGEALLVQHNDGNAYEIRPIKSISTDDLTPLFDLDNAPASGVSLGRATTYYPAQTGHDSLSLWMYLGNGGNIKAISGARPTSLAIGLTAGQPITMDVSLEGLSGYANPLIVTSSNKYIEVDEDSGGDVAVSIEEKAYKDPGQLAQALEDALNDSSSLSGTYTVTYSHSTGKFTIAVTSVTTLDISWKTGTTHGADNGDSHIGTLLGFSDSADDTGALSYEGDNAIALTAPHTPSYDSTDLIVAKNLRVMLGGTSDNTCFNAQSVAFNMSLTRGVVDDICAESGRSSSNITERTASAQVSAVISQYDVEQFERLRKNTEVGFAVAFGTKSGNNWVKTKAGCLSILSGTISEPTLAEVAGLYQLQFTVTAFVDSNANDEVALSFV